MQIILVHHRFAQARSLTLRQRHLFFACLAFVLCVLLAAAMLSWYALRHAAQLADLSVLAVRAQPAAPEDTRREDRIVKENLAAMAVKLGEMQAQLMRLDALGERVQGLAGIKPQEFNFRTAPGQGGPAPVFGSPQGAAPGVGEFRQALDALARDVEHRADYLNVVETTLMNQKISARMLPTVQPVDTGYNASSFGRRIDPFTGHLSFHEGIDFSAPAGTPIVAAAGGVVIAAQYHPQYGNMLEIDHGNDIVTRYAHASRLLRRVGDIVRRGQHIANVGSTGRSTGPHLHFEVLVKGLPQNPHKFLMAGNDRASLAALARDR